MSDVILIDLGRYGIAPGCEVLFSGRALPNGRKAAMNATDEFVIKTKLPTHP
jgi:hypothetical protein